MGEAKTRPSGSSVDDYLASRASAEQLSDLDQEVLEQLVVGSLTEVRRRQPPLSVQP